MFDRKTSSEVIRVSCVECRVADKCAEDSRSESTTKVGRKSVFVISYIQKCFYPLSKKCCACQLTNTANCLSEFHTLNCSLRSLLSSLTKISSISNDWKLQIYVADGNEPVDPLYASRTLKR